MVTFPPTASPSQHYSASASPWAKKVTSTTQRLGNTVQGQPSSSGQESARSCYAQCRAWPEPKILPKMVWDWIHLLCFAKTPASMSPVIRFNNLQAKTCTFHTLIPKECCMSSVFLRKHFFTIQKINKILFQRKLNESCCHFGLLCIQKSSMSSMENSLCLFFIP